MNYIVVNSVCCCLNLCCKQSWQTLYKILGKHSFIKIAYCLVYFSVIGISIFGINLLSQIPWGLNIASGISCNNYDQSSGLSCVTASVIYRVSFCLFLFSLFMLLLVKICSNRVALILNQGLFFSKFVILMGMVLISLNLDNKYFTGFQFISSIFSYIFAITQAIILVDLAYLWGIKWAQKYSQGRNCYAVLLIGASVLLFVISLFFLISSFKLDNGLNWSNYLCIFAIILMVAVQLLNFNTQNSLLTTSSICLLVCYYTWGANISHPLNSSTSDTQFYFQVIVSFLLMMLCTGGSIYGATNKQDQNQQFIDFEQNVNQRNVHRLQQNREYQVSLWTNWLLYLCGLSVYSCMIITDWGSSDIMEQKFNVTTNAWLSKLIMGTFITIIYVWTLVAPKICPHRNFYFQ